MFQFQQTTDQNQNQKIVKGSICIPSNGITVINNTPSVQTNLPSQQIISPNVTSPLSTSPIASPIIAASPVIAASPTISASIMRYSLSPQASFSEGFQINNVPPNQQQFIPHSGSFVVINPNSPERTGSILYTIPQGQFPPGQSTPDQLINQLNLQQSAVPISTNLNVFGVTSNTTTPLLPPELISKACIDLKDAIDSFTVDESKLINALGKYPPYQMEQIIELYKIMNGITLESKIKDITSGNFGKLCVALTKSVLDFDVWCLHNAIEGLGTDEDCLIDILVGRTNSDIILMNRVYKETYNKSLEDDVRGDTSGNFRNLLISILQGNREDNSCHHDVETDTDILYKAGEGRMGTDENIFITIFTNRSYDHLKLVFDRYQQKYTHSMEKAVNGEFSGDIKKALLAMVKYIKDPHVYIAELFEKSMKGLGTKNDMLIRLTVRYRDPLAMSVIKDTYIKMYGKTLKKRIEGDTSGNYRKLLYSCIGEI